jgi:hypothetical protein
MGIKLTELDEGIHEPGDEINWNESRYIDFWDPVRRTGGWFRIGARPNASYAEMSACIFLPDGRVAFGFDRAEIHTNGLTAGGQTWEITEPWQASEVGYVGPMSVFADPWLLVNPKKAFSESPKADAEVDLRCTTDGLTSTMGQDQDQHHLIFLPGQADFHYQHMVHVVGTVRLGDEVFEVDGRGGKDHSWGPRNWHAKIYLRWLTCCIDDGNGFMLTRAVGPTKTTRSGFVLVDHEFSVVDGFEMTNHYADGPNYELVSTDLVIRSADRAWTVTGTPQNYLPLRHRQRNDAGDEATLRIVKMPAAWTFDDGVSGTGHLEFHDLVEDSVPVGLHD